MNRNHGNQQNISTDGINPNSPASKKEYDRHLADGIIHWILKQIEKEEHDKAKSMHAIAIEELTERKQT